MAAREMNRLLGGKGKLVVFRYEPGHASTTKREEGFLSQIAEFPGIEVISENQYAGDRTKAQNKALNMEDTLREAAGIFCPNESSTAGVRLALQKLQLVGKVHFVGFDVTSELLDAVDKGHIQALVIQDPYRMGYQSVEVLVHKLSKKNEKPDPIVKTALKLVTRENRNPPEVAKILATQQ